MRCQIAVQRTCTDFHLGHHSLGMLIFSNNNLVHCFRDLKSSLLPVSTPFAMGLCRGLLLCLGIIPCFWLWLCELSQCDIHSHDAWRVFKSAFLIGFALLRLCHHHEMTLPRLVHWSQEEDKRQAQQNHPPFSHRVCDWVQQRPESLLNWVQLRLANTQLI